MSEIAKPIPLITADMQPFFTAAQRGELYLQRCSACGTFRFPAREWCSTCLSREASWQRASGRGEVYSFTVMHQVYHPAFAAEAPYAVAIVKLDEGPKLTTNLIGVAVRDIRIGMPVDVEFEPYGEGVALPKFRPR